MLLRECIDLLLIKPDGVYIDGTLGRGGHSIEIARHLISGRLIGIDRDPGAIREAGKNLSPYTANVTLIHSDFRNLERIMDELLIDKADGMLFDLGVSSPQLDDARRGFSYMHDAPLDMRMDPGDSLTAYDVINSWTGEELKRIFYTYGEERYAPRIASAIVKRREKQPILTTAELVDTIRSSMPASALREKQHPAKRSFQAIRIAVNDELTAVEDMLSAASDRLKTGGRLAVISFHSLEDRIVKNAIAARERGCTCPREFPVCVCGFKQTLRSVTKKPVTASPEEVEKNPRSRSAKLRVAEKV